MYFTLLYAPRALGLRVYCVRIFYTRLVRSVDTNCISDGQEQEPGPWSINLKLDFEILLERAIVNIRRLYEDGMSCVASQHWLRRLARGSPSMCVMESRRRYFVIRDRRVITGQSKLIRGHTEARAMTKVKEGGEKGDEED